MKLAACRSCGAPILWAITLNDRRIPLDADPITTVGDDPRGLFALLQRPEPPIAIGLDALPRDAAALGPTLRRSHFATCPNADEHRRGPGYGSVSR